VERCLACEAVVNRATPIMYAIPFSTLCFAPIEDLFHNLILQ
jgi:hypothetical protein